MFRQFQTFILLLFVSTVVGSSPKPNIMFVQADDLGYGDIGLYNAERNGDTPNIDSMGKIDGVYLTNYRILSPPVCSPSRAALLVGMEGQVAGFPNIADCPLSKRRLESDFYQATLDNTLVTRRTMNDCVLRLNESWPSLSHVLHYAGYYNVLLGKWHCGCDRLPPAQAYGWDFVKAYNTDRNSWNFWAEEDTWFWEDKHEMGNAIVFETERIIQEQKNGAFFFYVNPILPHAPLSPRREHMIMVGPETCDLNRFFADGFRWSELNTTTYMSARSKAAQYRRSSACIERVYRGSIFSFDVFIGQLIAVLRKHALFEDTLFIVTSDNGPETRTFGRKQPLGRFSQVGTTAGFRGHKRSLYDGGCKVPLIISWPAMRTTLQQRATYLSNKQVLNVDFLPTFAALAGVSSYLEQRPDARRVGRPIDLLLIHRVKDNSARNRLRKIVFWEWAYPQLDSCEGKAPRFAVMSRDSGIKFLGDYQPETFARIQAGESIPNVDKRSIFRRYELFNLSSDPYEKHNLLQNINDNHTLWTVLIAPLARALAQWIREILPVTRGYAHQLHDSCTTGNSIFVSAIKNNASKKKVFRRPRRRRHQNAGKVGKADMNRIQIEDQASPDPLFSGEQLPPLSWSQIVRRQIPLDYDHFTPSSQCGIWCGYDECFVSTSVSPWTNSKLYAEPISNWKKIVNRGNPIGFILVANNPILNTLPKLCPPPNWRVFRFNDCKSEWPSPSSQDIILHRCAPTPSGYWGFSSDSRKKDCSVKFGLNLNSMLIGGSGGPFNLTFTVLEQIWRLPKKKNDNNRKIHFSTGSTMALHLRHAFPNKPILAFGFTFHREYSCKMHSASDCPFQGHNYTLERLILSAVPRLRDLQTTSEIKQFISKGGWSPMKTNGSFCPTSLF